MRKYLVTFGLAATALFGMSFTGDKAIAPSADSPPPVVLAQGFGNPVGSGQQGFGGAVGSNDRDGAAKAQRGPAADKGRRQRADRGARAQRADRKPVCTVRPGGGKPACVVRPKR